MMALRKNILWVIPLLLVLGFAVHATLYYFYVVDDAFISMRYAVNWAHGYGPVYNPGEHVDGYTNFLWVVLLALSSSAGFDLFFATFYLSYSFSVCSLALVIWLIRRHPLGKGFLPSSIAVLVLGLNPVFVRSEIERLETALFIMLVLASMARLWYETQTTARVYPWSGLLLALVTLTRPDGILYVPLFGLWAIWQFRQKGSSWQKIGQWVLGSSILFVLPVGIWFVWHWSYYGAPLANTFYAKAGGPLDIRIERGLDSLDRWWNLTGSILLLAAILIAMTALAPNPAWWALLSLAVLCRIGFHLYSGGSYIGFLRFLTPAFPMLAGMAGISFAAIWRSASRSHVAKIPTLVLLIGLFIGTSNLPDTGSFYSAAQNAMRGLIRGHIALGKHLAEIAPSEASIAIQDAGAVPYYSGLTTIDIVGLNDAHIAHLEGDLYQKTDVAYVLSRKPTYIVLVSTEDIEVGFVPAKYVDVVFYADANFQAQYQYKLSYLAGVDYYLCVFERKQ
jgi:hypothetical protein